MNYKNYTAHIEYSHEPAQLTGHIAGISDVIGFHADSLPQLHEAFEAAVEDYPEACQKLGRAPQKALP